MSKSFRMEFDVKELPQGIRELGEILPEEAADAPGEIERLIWAENGACVGRRVPSAEPETAESDAGESANLAAPDPLPSDFHLGSGLELRNEEIFALSEGVVRVGDNWADLVPIFTHRWSLDGGIDEGGCFLHYRPGNPNISAPSAQDIIAAAGRIGFLAEKLLSEKELRALLANAIEDRQILDDFPISKDTDAKIELNIDPMRLIATLSLRKGSGTGKFLELNDVAAIIRESGLRGLDGPKVKEEIRQFHKGSARTTQILLKEGKAPQRGPDRELEFSVPFLSDEEFDAIRERIKKLPDSLRGVVSLKEFPPELITKMAPVSEEQTIAVLKPAIIGASGKNIDGETLPGYPGNDPKLLLHEGLGWDERNLITTESGILDFGIDAAGVQHLRVRRHKDALISITVSPDALRATVSIRPPLGTGAPADSQRIKEAALEANVVKGLLEQQIEQAAKTTLTGEIVTAETIAEGRLPMEANTRLSLSVSGDPAKAPVNVKEGETIGEIQSDEESGWNVHGEPLVYDGERIGTGNYIDRREEDGRTVLVAEKNGHLVMENGKLLIRHLLDYVGDVSLASGNIRFPGKIKVEGSVLSRVIVDAGDSVEVTEVIQAALVNSGADIKVGKGIKGEGKAVLRSQGNMSFAYAEDANLLATGDITAVKALMNCRVKCNGRLSIPGDQGKLIGGIMKLKEGLDIFDLGNERGMDTVVSFGQDYLVENQIDQIVKEQKKIQDFMNKADKLMAEQQRKGNNNGLIVIREKKVDALKLLNKKNLRLFLLREKFEKHFESQVIVRGTLWPGVTVESHGRLMKIGEPVRRVKIIFNTELGRLERRPL